jgi:hypothetical protein
MYTRARVVYKYIGMQGCKVSIQLGKQYEKIDFDKIKDFKFFVIEKVIDPRILFHLKDLARSNHGAVIFDLDDLFYDLHPQHKLFHQYDPNKEDSKRNIEGFEYIIKNCDHVFYSTRELMGYLHHLNPNCSMFPNFLDIEDRYSKATKRDWKSLAVKQGCHVDDDTTIIGFYGSESHTPDLENLGEIIHKILQQNPNTLIGICFGVDGIAHVCYHKWQIPYNKFVYFHVKNLKEFLNDVKCFDIGIAPLIHSKFNYSKTALKLIVDHTSEDRKKVLQEVLSIPAVNHNTFITRAAGASLLHLSSLACVLGSDVARSPHVHMHRGARSPEISVNPEQDVLIGASRGK